MLTNLQQKHPFIGNTNLSAPAYEELKDQMSQLRDMINHVLDSLSHPSKVKIGENNGINHGGVETTGKYAFHHYIQLFYFQFNVYISNSVNVSMG